MSILTYPYQLVEGTKAYANKVMSNLNAIKTLLNAITAGNISSGDLQTVITALASEIETKVNYDTDGNADEIIFTDGDTLQHKFDGGDLSGTDGVASYLNGFFTVAVNEYGHLIVTTAGDENPFSFNSSGHLIITIPDSLDADTTVTYDLGDISSIGEVSTAQMNAAISAAIAAMDSAVACVAYVLGWSSSDNDITCAGITSTNTFFVEPATAATSAEVAAYQAANVRVTAQETDQFTLTAEGTTPTIDIPLKVTIIDFS